MKKIILLAVFALMSIELFATSVIAVGPSYSYGKNMNVSRHTANLNFSYELRFGKKNLSYGGIALAKAIVPMANLHSYEIEKGFKYTGTQLSLGPIINFALADNTSLGFAILVTYELIRLDKYYNGIGLTLYNDFNIQFNDLIGLKLGYSIYYPLKYNNEFIQLNNYFEFSPFVLVAFHI